MHDKLGGTQNIGQGKGRKKIHKRSASADTPNWAEKLSPFVWSFFDTLSPLHFGGCGVDRKRVCQLTNVMAQLLRGGNFHGKTFGVGNFHGSTCVACYFGSFFCDTAFDMGNSCVATFANLFVIRANIKEWFLLIIYFDWKSKTFYALRMQLLLATVR